MFLFVIVVAVCLKCLNGFQNGHSVVVRQVKCMNLYLNPKPILQNDNQSNSLLTLSFKKNQNTITSQDIDDAKSTSTKGTDLLINVLYKGLLIEPVFGTLGLLKSTEEIKKEKDLKILTIPSLIRSNNNKNKSSEPFESKLTSMMSLEEKTILNENNMKDNVLSVTMAPKSKSTTSSSTLKPPTVAFTSTTTTAPSSSSSPFVKKADFKDELWVVRKLKEIRTRENEVVAQSSSSSSSSAPSVVTKSPPNTSANSITKASISTNGISATAAATPVKSAFVSKTPPAATTVTTTPAVRTPSSAMVASSNTDKIKSAVSNFFSPQPPVGTVTVAPPTLKIATTAAEAVTMATSTSLLATSSTASADSSSSLQSDSFYELLPTSIISEGLVYGNVDKNAVDFDISADTFKLPTINVEENTEFTAAQQAIKTAGVSGTLAYALSEVV